MSRVTGLSSQAVFDECFSECFIKMKDLGLEPSKTSGFLEVSVLTGPKITVKCIFRGKFM